MPSRAPRAAVSIGVIALGLAVLAPDATPANPIETGPGSLPGGDGGTHVSDSARLVPGAERPPPPGALYVSPRGDDRAAGREERPLRTIGAALRRVRDGGTVVVGSGTYHESLEIERTAGVTLRSAPGAEVWVDGSRPVTGWERSGSAWVHRGWTAEFDSSPTYTWGEPDNDEENFTFIDPAHPMAAHPDQVWLDDRPQVQVGSLAEVGPGRFFVDDEADALYVGSDPTGREVEASDLAKAISVRAAGTTLSGIGVRRFASSVPHMGSVTVEAPGARLRDLQIEDNATNGLHVMEPDVVISRVRLVGNGMMGMTATGARGLLLDRVRAIGNNRERFNTSPAAGGVKIGRSQDVTVRDSVFRRNLGTGLWFDESVHDITLLGNRSVRNLVHGASLELSGEVLAVRNLFAHNGGNGVKINDTDNVRMWNNTFVGNVDELTILQDDRDLDAQGSYLDDSLPLTFRNGPVVLRNNLFGETSSRSDCLVCVIDYSERFSAEQMGVSARGNLYQRPAEGRPATPVQWSRGEDTAAFRSLAQFRRATGQERGGKLVLAADVVGSSLRPTRAVDRIARSVATPLPRALARLVGAAGGTRRIGAW